MTEPKRRPGRPATGVTPSRSIRLGPIYDRALTVAHQCGDKLPAIIEAALKEYVMQKTTFLATVDTGVSVISGDGTWRIAVDECGTVASDGERGVVATPWARDLTAAEIDDRDWDALLAAAGWTVVGAWEDHDGYWTATVNPTFDPRTGTFALPADDPRREVMEAEARTYVAREMEDPCLCPVVSGPHTHAPYAYPAGDGTLGG